MTQTNSTISVRTEFVQGIKACVPVVFAAAPFGALFGAAAISHGLPVFETLAASLLMYAGASQFVFLEIYGLGVPAWSVVLAVFAVNFRHFLYSASIGRKLADFKSWRKWVAFFFLTDPQWADAERRHQSHGIRPAFYFGYAFLLYLGWIIGTGLGVVFGSLISEPKQFGFDMLLPIYFLTILMGFRQRANWTSVVLVSGFSSLIFFHFIGSPWHISLGAFVGIGLAAMLPLKEQHNE